MALRSQVIHLTRLDLVYELHQTGGVGEVAVVQLEVLALFEGQRVLVEVPDPGCVEGTGAADDAVHLVTFREEQLGKVGTVLGMVRGIANVSYWTAHATPVSQSVSPGVYMGKKSL